MGFVSKHEVRFELSISTFVNAPVATILPDGVGEGGFFARHI